jgi:uncharacterized protein
MSNDEKTARLVPSSSPAISRSGVASLILRGIQEVIAKAEAEQCLKKGREFAAQERHEEAFASFMRGIEFDPRHSELLCHLADAYHMGYGVQENDVKALALYRQAAEDGDLEGLLCVGWHYASGYGVPQDDVEAVKWWRIAAEQGSSEAQFLLGSSYEVGCGVTKDLANAVYWHRKAAEQDERQSREALDHIVSKNGRP